MFKLIALGVGQARELSNSFFHMVVSRNDEKCDDDGGNRKTNGISNLSLTESCTLFQSLVLPEKDQTRMSEAQR